MQKVKEGAATVKDESNRLRLSREREERSKRGGAEVAEEQQELLP